MEIRVSKDIRTYKAKDIGNFSFKEAGLIALGVVVAGVVYKLTDSLEYAIPPLVICLAFGFLKPFGMTLMQFIRTVVRDAITPRVYINETDFVYTEDVLKEIYGEDVELVTEEEPVIQTADSSMKNKKKKDLFI